MNNQELHCYVVPEEASGERLDAFLAKQQSSPSRSAIQRLITKQLVTVNEKSFKSSYLVKAGDTIYVQESRSPLLPITNPTEEPLPILYEDDNLLIINKPANMVVHPTSSESRGTVVQSLLYHGLQIADAIYDTNSLISRMRPGIVHRLDKDTTGILLVAKTKEALLNLSNQFKEHTVEKEYIALVSGSIRENTTVHTNITRQAKERTTMGVRLDDKGREAITHIAPLEHYTWHVNQQELTLIKCRIETGRTHQIRVHCKYIGHPVIGDSIYTNKPTLLLNKQLRAKRQLLHARQLTFTNPSDEKPITFTAPLPQDLIEILTKLTPPDSLE